MRRIASLVLTLAACAAVPAAAHAAGTLTVEKNIAKAGTVSAGVGEIDCGITCSSQSAFFGNDCSENTCTPQEVGVTAVAQPGWAVTGYSNCSDGGDGWCMVVMSRSVTVGVTFADVGAPTVTLGAPAQFSAVRGSLPLTATAADNDAVARVEFYAGGVKVAEDSTAPYAATVDTAVFPDGARTFSVKSFDAAGNVSAEAARSLLVDNAKPVVQITGGTAEGAIVGGSGSASFAFAGSDPTSGVAQMQCALDGGSAVACDSATAHAIALAGVAEGAQKFLVRAVDAAGNMSDWAQRSFTVDRTEPALAFTDGPPHEAAVPGDVVYGFSAGDASGVTVTCAIDGAFGPCTSAAGHAAAGLADGPHSINVRAIDAAGNQSEMTRTFHVDRVAPVVTFASGPGEGTAINTPATQFTWTAADAGAGVEAVRCKLDDGGLDWCDGGSSESLAGLKHGPHTLTVRVIDQAGNHAEVTRTFSVDLEVPETTIGSVTPGATSTFTFSASEENATFKCRVYKAGATPPAFGDCSGNGTHAASGLAAGEHIFEVVATDAAGNADATPAKKLFAISTATVPPKDTTGDDTTPSPPPVVETPGGDPVKPQPPASGKPAWTAKFKRAGRRTRVAKLQLTGVPAGATVEVTCAGKGCAFKKKKASSHDLLPLFKRRALASGARIEIRVAGVRLVTFTIRPRGKATEKAG